MVLPLDDVTGHVCDTRVFADMTAGDIDTGLTVLGAIMKYRTVKLFRSLIDAGWHLLISADTRLVDSIYSLRASINDKKYV